MSESESTTALPNSTAENPQTTEESVDGEQIPIPVSWPSDGKLSLEWIHDLMSTLDWSSRNLAPTRFPSVFPIQVFDSLVLTASKILHKEPNCVKIDALAPESTVVVVGDLHGQLHDLLYLLKNAGFPSDDRFFVFNGDYVDRGAWGLETFLLLLAWKVNHFEVLSLIIFYCDDLLLLELCCNSVLCQEDYIARIMLLFNLLLTQLCCYSCTANFRLCLEEDRGLTGMKCLGSYSVEI